MTSTLRTTLSVAGLGISLLSTLAGSQGCHSLKTSRLESAATKLLGERQQLQQAIQASPTAVDARLALARYDARNGFPSSAIQQFHIVQRASGIVGSRLNDADTVLYRELLLRRGQARLRTKRAGAIDDFATAKQLGAAISNADETTAKLQSLIADARHSDDHKRMKAMAGLCTMSAKLSASMTAVEGACAAAEINSQRRYARWLWQQTAHRASFEVLTALPAMNFADNLLPVNSRRVDNVHWLSVMQWWQGRVIPTQWRTINACDALRVAAELSATEMSVDGVVALQKRAIADIASTSLAAYTTCRAELTALGVADRITVWLADDTSPHASWPAAPDLPSTALQIVEDELMQTFATRWLLPLPTIEKLAGLANNENSQIQSWIDSQLDQPDAAAAAGEWLYIHRQFGPAQQWWQYAVNASTDPWYAQGLAVAAAANGDSPAAMVWANRGAAAWGDPAAALLEVATALETAKQHAEAISLLRQALSLTGPTLRASIEIATDNSLRALGRPPVFSTKQLAKLPTTSATDQHSWQSRAALTTLVQARFLQPQSGSQKGAAGRATP